jgi:hypothetical protein
MIVVGGTYRERISFPSTDVMFGSGLKAAATLAKLSRKVKLLSAVSPKELDEAKCLSSTFEISATFFKRQAPITFSYITPLAKPLITGANQKKLELKADGSVVLVFGMLEATTKIKAERLIFDPQSPNDAAIPSNLSEQANRLAIVLNRQEISEITGSKDSEKAGRKLIKKTKAEVVVIKCGALGALVLTSKRSTWIGAHPTEFVWPIGSGDVFSAVFAWAWGEKKYPAVKSAKLASGGAALWCSSKVLPLEKNLEANIKKLNKPIKNRKPMIYLAAPFFSVAETWLVEVTREALLNLGAGVFSPLHDIGRGQDEVAKKDLLGLQKCSTVLALLDGEDTGTLFEVGHAIAQKKHVVAFTTFNESQKFKMLRGSKIKIYNNLSTAIYKAIWAGCEKY